MTAIPPKAIYPATLVVPPLGLDEPIDDQYRIEMLPLIRIEGQHSWQRLEKSAIDEWMQGEALKDVLGLFARYPRHSLLSSVGRAFLYHLIRCARPADVAEIGTYWAGTAEVMARALHANNFGHLYTCDPFGAERAPVIISQWPLELQQRVTFLAANSMGFADYLRMREIRLDLAFVDGCHDFEYALFDVLTSARLMRPGGIVVMDNAEHPGVVSAFREFMRMNPDWRALSTFDRGKTLADPFSQTLERSSVPETTFIILEAPRFASVPAETYVTTGQQRFEGRAVSDMRFSALPGVAGTLHFEGCLRGFGSGMPIEVKGIGTRRIPRRLALREIVVPWNANLASSPDYISSGVDRCTAEITLYWVPDDGVSTLKLVELPVAFAPEATSTHDA